MSWFNDLPDGAWGLFGAVVGGGIATWSGWWLRRRERRADLARENRREVYEPALAELRAMKRVLDSDRFPTTITFDPSSSRPSELLPTGDVFLDISWWESLKDQGAHLRIAPSIRQALETVEESCSTYRQVHSRYLDAARTTLLELMKASHVTTASVPDHEHFLTRTPFRTGIGAYLLRGEEGKNDLTAALMNALYDKDAVVREAIQLLEGIASIEETRSAANALQSRIAAAETDLERHINEMLKRHDIRDESV